VREKKDSWGGGSKTLTLTLSQREREQSSNAVYLDFALEVLQSSNLALVAAVLPLCSDVF